MTETQYQTFMLDSVNNGRFKLGVKTDSQIKFSPRPSKSVLEAERGKQGFVYKWVNQINGRWYVGSHIGNPNDGYVAGGQGILNAIRKHGLKNFKREILYQGLDCRVEEERILVELNAAADPMSYNWKNQAWGGSFPGKLNGMFGKPASISQRLATSQKQRRARPERSQAMMGNNNPMWGKTHTPEVILRTKIVKETRKKEWSFLPSPKVYSQHLRSIYRYVQKFGTLCSPRGLPILEVENLCFDLPPYLRFTNFQSRKLNLGYIKQELLWYLKGELTDLTIGNHAKLWNELVVDGRLNSNYGHYIFKEKGIDWVVEELTRDKDSRRAVITILSSQHLNAREKDIPCTYGMSFRIRNGKLNMSVRLRSNDCIFGFTNDLPFFSFIQEMVLKYLQRVYPELEMGIYHHGADSFHVYERHFEMLKKLVERDQFSVILCPQMSSAEEVDFLRAGNFSTIPESFKFAKWLWDTQNLDVLGNYTFTNKFFK